MPYISEASKKSTVNSKLVQATFEEKVDAVIEQIRVFNLDDREGLCNYAISRIVSESLKPQVGGWKYKHLNRAYGTFLSAAAEFYRRRVVPYENRTAEKNGDIYETND